MSDNPFRQFGEHTKREKAQFKVKLAVFSFFVIVALILWYLNKLSYEYTADVSFPVRFENMPSGKILVGEPPKYVVLNVRGFGYTLLKYRLSSKLTPISINLQNAGVLSKQDDEHKYMLITNRSRHLFSGYLSNDLILEKVSPDTIFFQFTNLAERRVRVIPNVSYSIKKQYMDSGPLLIKPDSVTIVGPHAIIDTLSGIRTVKHFFADVDRPLHEKLSLVTIPQVSMSHRNVEVTVPVERYTEANVSIPIEVRNLPDSLRLIILPRLAQVKCNVVLSDYQNIETTSLWAYVDYYQIEQMLGNRLTVRVESKPYVVSDISFEPQFVEFFIEKLQ